MSALIVASNPDTPADIESTEPDLVMGYQTTWESSNIFHDVIGAERPTVTLRPAALRTGTLALFYDDETAAWRGAQMHRQLDTFVYTDTERPAHSMTYAVDGRVQLELDSATLSVWFVTVPYREV